ncbi:hypothetical protein HMPREF9440_00706 [Sutterella parvirubra YIT 11816]|uniref:Uncharacterized protein n=1 Tax=Sutterella parvirubra YIT 11816 TaxID=762967 RepID=H3KD97_9BURK|nr:hypothetical protein HMPREF9440_00706 [Sutterella parvirubra YIT 11816]
MRPWEGPSSGRRMCLAPSVRESGAPAHPAFRRFPRWKRGF